MSYWTECDWCGKSLVDEDRAEMRVTIYRTKGRTELQAAWAKEVKVTRHFCVAPKDRDLDEAGHDRMGLTPDEAVEKSCYDRAIEVLTGTPTDDPGKGYEWRLMPVAPTTEKVSPAIAPSSVHDATPLPEVVDLPDASAGRRHRTARGTSLSEAGLTPRARHALVRADIVTLEEVAERTEAELMALNGVGPHSIEQLAAALERCGFPPLRRDAVLIADRVRTLRLESGLSHDDLARRLGDGIYGSDVQAWEHGKKFLNDRTAAKLAELFGVTVDWLMVREAKVA
jgi:DNA-binding XRE family transcriptional regulator